MNHRQIILSCIAVSLLLFACSEDNSTSDSTAGECSLDSDCKDYEECENGRCVLAGEFIDGDKEAADDSDGDDSDGDDSDGDSAETVCEPGEIACKDDKTLEKCSSDGQSWAFYRECGSESICFEGNCVLADGDGECVGCVCIPESFRCHGAREVERCMIDGSDWSFYRTCEAGDICLDGACQSTVDGDDDDDMEEPPLGDICEDNEDCYEDNHYCLIDDFVQETGHCQPYCYITGVHCPAGFYCGEGTCHPISGYCISDAQCGIHEFCDIRPTASDGMCIAYCNVPGQQCPNHTECDADPQSLNYGKCVYNGDVDYCSTDGECGYNRWCYIPIGWTEGFCQDMCMSDDDCTSSLVCKDGKCQTGVPVPDCGPAGCAKGYVCDPMYNACVLNCPPCDDGWYCNADSAPNCVEYCVPPTAGICGFGLPVCCPPQSCDVFEWIYGVYGVCV